MGHRMGFAIQALAALALVCSLVAGPLAGGTGLARAQHVDAFYMPAHHRHAVHQCQHGSHRGVGCMRGAGGRRPH